MKETDGSSLKIQAPSCTNPLRIEALGPFRLFVGEAEILPAVWKNRRALLLLQYLLTREPGRLVSKEAIMEALWPKADRVHAYQSLRAAITALRRVLEPGLRARRSSSYLHSATGQCALALGDGGYFDVIDFDRKIALAAELERRGDVAQAASEYEAAIALYRGDFLEDQPCTRWAFPLRERLAESWGQALVRLGTFCLDRGRIADACRLGLRALEADAAWEAAYRLILAAYARSGQWRRVTVIYEQYKNTMQEYDLPPPPSLKSLLGGIRPYQ